MNLGQPRMGASSREKVVDRYLNVRFGLSKNPKKRLARLTNVRRGGSRRLTLEPLTSVDYQTLKGGIDKSNVWHRKFGIRAYPPNHSLSKCVPFKILLRFIHFLLVDALAFSREVLWTGDSTEDMLTSNQFLAHLLGHLKVDTFAAHLEKLNGE